MIFKSKGHNVLSSLYANFLKFLQERKIINILTYVCRMKICR